jgi:hypothetical protein
MARRILLLWAVLAVGLVAAPVVAAETVPADTVATLPVALDEAYFAQLDELSCTDLNGFAYKEIPDFVLADRPDLVYELVLYWKGRCLTTEPVFRAIVLGAIWDAAFDEDLYDEEVIQHLIDRNDPPTKSRTPDLRRRYDEFTQSFADQLLPHVPPRSLEAFFCLYYSGKTPEAWALLTSDDLEDTWLRYYYDQEMRYLNRRDPIPNLQATGGGWWPSGDMEFAGDKPLVGLLAGVRWPNWLARFVFEIRVGRTTEPYFVTEPGIQGRSNRFDAMLIGAEGGRILYQKGRHNLDLFVGAGLDAVEPFQDEEFVLGALNISVGLGYRFFLGKNRNVMLGVDARHEWVGDRNERTRNLGGQAWSLRFSLGYRFDKGNTQRLNALTR